MTADTIRIIGDVSEEVKKFARYMEDTSVCRGIGRYIVMETGELANYQKVAQEIPVKFAPSPKPS